MLKDRSSEKAHLFIGMLYSRAEIFNLAKKILEKTYGDILYISQPVQWDSSIFYRDELGWPIYRQFIFFKNSVDPGTLADIKLETIAIEKSFSSSGKRQINLDPGYITLAKVVLASTKNYSHRIYLGKGIYAEITLIFRKDQNLYMPHLFTYRDYQDKICIDMFMNVRDELKKMQG